MIGKYIGNSGSMGLRYNNIYQFQELQSIKTHPIVIKINVEGNAVICTYNSLTDFLNNWKVMQ